MDGVEVFGVMVVRGWAGEGVGEGEEWEGEGEEDEVVGGEVHDLWGGCVDR